MPIQTVFYNFIEDTMKEVFLSLHKRNSLLTLLRYLNEVNNKHSHWFDSNNTHIPKKKYTRATLDIYDQLIFFAETLESTGMIRKSNIVRGELLSIWDEINRWATTYFADIFSREYGHIFQIETLEELMNLYFTQPKFDPYSERNFIPFIYYLMNKQKFVEKRFIRNDRIVTSFEESYQIFIQYEKRYKITEYSKTLSTPRKEYGLKTIDDIDMMTGLEFVDYIGMLFEKWGFSVLLTKSSGDQGVALIVEKNKKRIGIQTKCSSSPLSNKAVQEIVAGTMYYDLEKGMYITNNYFTAPAKKLAAASQIVLWDRDMLKIKLNVVEPF